MHWVLVPRIIPASAFSEAAFAFVMAAAGTGQWTAVHAAFGGGQ